MNPTDLLREFAEYTPHFLLRLVADGAAGTLLIAPNILGLFLYAVVAGRLTGFAISTAWRFFVQEPLQNWLLWARIGTLVNRFLTYLTYFTKWLLHAWIGIPVLYVLGLILSDDPAAAIEFNNLISGYSWQVGVVERLPIQAWPEIFSDSRQQTVVSMLLILAYFVDCYIYYHSGFLLAKRIRETHQLLWSIVGGTDTSYPTAAEVLARLRTQGWTDESARAALLFLNLRNAMSVSQDSFNAMSPGSVGAFHVVKNIGLVVVFQSIHPLIAAAWLYLERPNAGAVRRANSFYRKLWKRLPQEIQSKLSWKI